MKLLDYKCPKCDEKMDRAKEPHLSERGLLDMRVCVECNVFIVIARPNEGWNLQVGLLGEDTVGEDTVDD